MSSSNSCRLSAFYSLELSVWLSGVSAHTHTHTHKDETISDKVLCFQLEEEVWLDEEQQALMEELKMEILEERRKRAERNFDRGDEVSVKARERRIKARAKKLQFRARPVVMERYLHLLKSGKKVRSGTRRVQAVFFLHKIK